MSQSKGDHNEALPSGESKMLRVQIPLGDLQLDGDLTLPATARSIVLFAHGSGSSRHSPRNRYVARTLNEAGLATLLFDLLTPAEEAVDTRTAALRFDIPLLAVRLSQATDWLVQQPQLRAFTIGYFGASTGAAAAIVAAAASPHPIAAVVSRGGRPDLAAESLAHLRAPTLLIVGGSDTQVIDLNRQAFDRLRCEKRLEIVPGATHLFEEEGALQAVAQLARDWFITYLVAAQQ